MYEDEHEVEVPPPHAQHMLFEEKSLSSASVLPSATEILCFIGGESLLVGRSHEDNYPPQITHLPVITGQTTAFTTAAEVDKIVSESIGKGESLYTLDEALLRELKPDVILTQDLCEVCAIDLKTVERIIGFKKGTGGTPGVPYLAGVLKAAFFPELLSVRTAI